MIIVTGANGFIGSALVWELNQAGQHNLICVDTVDRQARPAPLADRHLERFLTKNEIWPFLETSDAARSVSAILHMGACSSTTETNVAFLHENNVDYTRRLWQWCSTHQKKFIYASSAAVYGDGKLGFDDASPSHLFRPLNPYGESKAAFDRWVETETAARKPAPPFWAGLRFFNVFGANEYHKGFMCSVPFKAFGEIMKKNQLTLFRSHHPDYRDGMQMRDFVYIKDITRWTIDLLESDGLASGIYNIGFGRARTWLELASAAFSAVEKPVHINWIDIPLEMQSRYQYFTEAKITRLLALGLKKPTWPLERAIEDYLKNYLVPGTQSDGSLLRSAYL